MYYEFSSCWRQIRSHNFADVELPQEAGNTPVKLPRQDSLDSSEWECLSHEQFLPEAQA